MDSEGVLNDPARLVRDLARREGEQGLCFFEEERGGGERSEGKTDGLWIGAPSDSVVVLHGAVDWISDGETVVKVRVWSSSC